MFGFRLKRDLFPLFSILCFIFQSMNGRFLAILMNDKLTVFQVIDDSFLIAERSDATFVGAFVWLFTGMNSASGIFQFENQNFNEKLLPLVLGKCL